jgi:hypothetical protein
LRFHSWRWKGEIEAERFNFSHGLSAFSTFCSSVNICYACRWVMETSSTQRQSFDFLSKQCYSIVNSSNELPVKKANIYLQKCDVIRSASVPVMVSLSSCPNIFYSDFYLKMA